MHEPKAEPDVLLFLDRLRASGVTNMNPLESFCPKCWKALEHEVEGKLRKTISSDPDDDRR